jgi:hypothetical protein
MDFIKKLVKLAIVLAIVHAAWRATPVYWSYVKFRDEVTEIARFSSGRSVKEIRDLVLESAYHLEVPLDPELIAISKDKNSTTIDASYVHPVELLPKYFYGWTFDVNVDVVHARPATLDQIR